MWQVSSYHTNELSKYNMLEIDCEFSEEKTWLWNNSIMTSLILITSLLVVLYWIGYQQNANNSENVWALGMFDVHIYSAGKIRSWGPPGGIFLITVFQIILMAHLFIRRPGRRLKKKVLKTLKTICLFLLKCNGHECVTGKWQVFMIAHSSSDAEVFWSSWISLLVTFQALFFSNLSESFNCSRQSVSFYSDFLCVSTLCNSLSFKGCFGTWRIWPYQTNVWIN